MEDRAWYKQPEMIIALSALLISLVTAAVSIYSAYVDRSFAKASMWPRLEIARSYSGGGEFGSFSYQVGNSGNGPAIIRFAKVQYDGKPVQLWRDIPNFDRFTQSHIGNRILSSQNIVKPIDYKGNNAEQFLESDAFVSIEICYCSIYEECWLVSRSNEPLEIDECRIDEKERFLQ